MTSERRHRFRAPTGLAVHWRPAETCDDWHEAVLMDISSGGARLRSRRAPTYHDLLLGAPIPDGRPTLVVRAELVRIESQLESGEFAWAMSFVDLNARTQARLARFAFSEARKQEAAEAEEEPAAFARVR